MTVVRNEFEAGKTAPSRAARTHGGKRLPLAHYGKAIIGARSDIETRADRAASGVSTLHYSTSDNAVLLCPGQGRGTTALRLAQKHFGKYQTLAHAAQTYTVDRPRTEKRAVTLAARGRRAARLGAHTNMPRGAHRRSTPAVTVLVARPNPRAVGAAAQGLSSRTGLASSVSARGQQREAGFAYFGREPEPRCFARDRARRAARRLEGFAKNPVTEDEVELARRAWVQRHRAHARRFRELTQRPSNYAGIGDWRVLYLHRDRLKRITAADVQAAATRYLETPPPHPGIVHPTPSPTAPEIPPVPDLAAALKDYRGSATVALGEDFNPTPANIEARVIRRTSPAA